MKTKTLGLVALVVAIATMLGAVSIAQQQTEKEKAKPATEPAPFPYTFLKALEIEKRNAHPITDFYATPKELKRPGGACVSRSSRTTLLGGISSPQTWGSRSCGFSTARRGPGWGAKALRQGHQDPGIRLG